MTAEPKRRHRNTKVFSALVQNWNALSLPPSTGPSSWPGLAQSLSVRARENYNLKLIANDVGTWRIEELVGFFFFNLAKCKRTFKKF